MDAAFLGLPEGLCQTERIQLLKEHSWIKSTRVISHHGDSGLLSPLLCRHCTRPGQDKGPPSLPFFSLSPSRIISFHGCFLPPRPFLCTPQPVPFSILTFFVIICG